MRSRAFCRIHVLGGVCGIHEWTFGILGGSWGCPGGALGVPAGALGEPWGAFGGPKWLWSEGEACFQKGLGKLVESKWLWCEGDACFWSKSSCGPMEKRFLSRGPLGALGVLVRPLEVLGGSWGLPGGSLGVPWGCLGSALECQSGCGAKEKHVLKSVIGDPGGINKGTWGSPGGPLGVQIACGCEGKRYFKNSPQRDSSGNQRKSAELK